MTSEQLSLLQYGNDARDLSGYIYNPTGQVPDGWEWKATYDSSSLISNPSGQNTGLYLEVYEIIKI